MFHNTVLRGILVNGLCFLMHTKSKTKMLLPPNFFRRPNRGRGEGDSGQNQCKMCNLHKLCNKVFKIIKSVTYQNDILNRTILMVQILFSTLKKHFWKFTSTSNTDLGSPKFGFGMVRNFDRSPSTI